MKNMLKDAGILLVITLLSGLILGTVYQITKEPIAAQKEKAKAEACQVVFEAAASFAESASFDAETAADVLQQGGFDGQVIDGVTEAKDASGALLGYVLTVTTKEGYGGDIQFTMGISGGGTLNGVSLLSISETPGLGMQAEEVLVPQFQDRKAEQFSYTKTGAAAEDQIDAISGATVTTNAMTNGVNAGLYYFQQILEGGDGNA